jgi:hypothetical protein
MLAIKFSIILPRAARELAQNKGCGLLSQEVADSYAVRNTGM